MIESGFCRNCKRPRDCPGKDFYTYPDIRWCRHQVIWILQNAGTLHAGQWPQPQDNVGGNINIKTEANYTKCIRTIAEVDDRLARAGIYGKLLRAQVEAGREYGQLDHEAYMALIFVSGWDRRRQSFRAWGKQNRYRQRLRKGQ